MSASKHQLVTPQQNHVARIVARHFQVRDNELLIGGILVSHLIEEFGSPLFVYDQSVIESKIKDLSDLLPGTFDLFYSIKANPNAMLLKCFLQNDCGLEVASAGELFQALNAGCSPDRLIFAGPGKTPDELAAAFQANIREIHVESIEEARCLSELASRRNRKAAIALRVNPVESSGGAMRMGGIASPFGIDEENLDDVLSEVNSLAGIEMVGVHLFMGTQILDAEVLINQYKTALSIARHVSSRITQPLNTIDFGGGWGTPYFPHEKELDLAAVATGIHSIDDQMKQDPLLASARGILEPGRFLVNESGVYLSRVTRVKHSRGKTFAVVDGGLHHHLAASGNLGQTIKRNYPVAIANKLGQPELGPVDVVGPLCTPLDVLARNVKLPTVASGDLFAVFLSGAYARTSSPLGFLSHPSPAEVLVHNGSTQQIRRRGKPDDCLRDQN